MPVLELVRHAMTQGNLERRYIGRTDEGLAPRGEELCRRSVRPPDRIPRRVWVSPLRRCVETARLLYPGAQLLPVADLRETDFGLFEGKRYEELQSLPEYRRWIDSEGKSGIPGGEDRTAFEARCRAALLRVGEELLLSGEERGAAVAHGGVIMAALSALGTPKRDFYAWQSPCCGGWELLLDPEWENAAGKFWILGPVAPGGGNCK